MPTYISQTYWLFQLFYCLYHVQISNKRLIVRRDAYYKEIIVKGQRLFWAECEAVRHLLEGAVYLRSDAHLRK